MTLDSLLITIVYTALLAWGVGVGLQLLWQGRHQPDKLINPLFRNRHALSLFALHMLVVSAHLFVIGPLSVMNKSTLWYWGGLTAVLSTSLPLAVYLNRNPQSFGKLIGRWVVFRNVFEVALHVAVAAAAVNWSYYYLLLWWVVAYRFLDVGPRRLLQKLYSTPEKLAARPWAPTLNWATIALLYVLTAWVVYREKVSYAIEPDEQLLEHDAQPFEIVLVLILNLAVAVLAWILTKRYTDSLLEETDSGNPSGPD